MLQPKEDDPKKESRKKTEAAAAISGPTPDKNWMSLADTSKGFDRGSEAEPLAQHVEESTLVIFFSLRATLNEVT